MATCDDTRAGARRAPWAEASGLSALHACRSHEAVAETVTAELTRMLPDTAVAICLATGVAGMNRVEVAVGAGCPWQVGDEIDATASLIPREQRVPVCYGEQNLGELIVPRGIDAEERAQLAAVAAHYGVARVNLTLNEECRQATENYCASLQALEEGVILFQEEDLETIQARLLSLAASMVRATAGALFVLRTIGDPESGLDLALTLGIPEVLLDGFHTRDGSPWPADLLGRPAQLWEREPDGSCGNLAAEGLPPILQNIVAMPLRYHGVQAGVCMLFNAAVQPANARDYLGRVTSLGQLGAALLHRVQLEFLAVQSRAMARELQIAETIQKRLIPASAPPSDEFEFAWSSIAARHIGGDYVDLIRSDLGDIYAVVADVSGHGINSALLMTSFRATYRGDAPWTEPAHLAATLNTEVAHEVGATGMFITAVMMRLDSRSREAVVTSAGHNPVLVYRDGSGEVEEVSSHGPALGFVAAADFAEQRVPLAAGDIVLLYTDGITEATDADLEMFGEQRLAAVLRQHAGAGAQQIVDALRAALEDFTGRPTCEDDVSLLVIKAR